MSRAWMGGLCSEADPAAFCLARPWSLLVLSGYSPRLWGRDITPWLEILARPLWCRRFLRERAPRSGEAELDLHDTLLGRPAAHLRVVGFLDKVSTVRPPGGPAGLRSDSTRYEADLEFRFRPAAPTTYPPRRRRNDLVTGEGPQLELRREDDVVVLAISGEFDVSSSATLDGMREEALEVGRPVVVDLTSCEFIDSHGLAGIIRIFNRATASDIPFALAGSGKQVKRVLDVSGLAHALPYFGELKDAIDHARLHEGERAKSPPIRFPPRI